METMFTLINTIGPTRFFLILLGITLPFGATIAFVICRNTYKGTDIGGKNYKLKHFLKELFHMYPYKRYGLRYKDEKSNINKIKEENGYQ